MDDSLFRELAGRVENMELELTVWNAKRSLSSPGKQPELRRLGACTLLRERTGPASAYYNRIKGFGERDLPLLPEMLDYYEEIGASPCFDMIPARVSGAVYRALHESGFAPAEELVFMAAAAAAYQPDQPSGPDGPNPATIETVHEGNAEKFIRWIELSQEGLHLDDGLVAEKKAFFYDPGFRNYWMESDGCPAAMGSLFIRGDEGYIANDFTFGPFRGRGFQAALLRHRLREAGKRGLNWVYTDVEPESASFRNMVRVGFRPVYHSVYWVK